MDLKRVSPVEAKKLVDEDAYTLVDVRSMAEYAAEHAAGALNIPYLHKTPQGMVPNKDFATVIRARFPDTSSKLVVTCQMGGRSLRAVAELTNLGYDAIVDLRGGFGGERDERGVLVNPGWKDSGLPIESGEPAGRSYPAIQRAVAPEPALGAGAEAATPAASTPTPAGAATGTPPAGGVGAAGAPDPLPAAVREMLGAAAGNVDGMNRFASTRRKVMCARFKAELPGLKRRPFPGPLGERVFREISAKAWDPWVEHQKMLVNEYRIRADDPAAMQLLIDQCEKFFFGDGTQLPEGFVPEGH
ncbi:MAG: oxidative damage protection protein [Deltaproteobacteria bacterium]|nr:oxidative damage protection protein [Deltaproteobacteria bacterium]